MASTSDSSAPSLHSITPTPNVDMAKLSADVRDRLAQLELELSEGDITQKGYDKRRAHLLNPYINGPTASGVRNTPSPGTRAHRRHQRRLTADENRFHSEIRCEAVQQALAEYNAAQRNRPNALKPVKRSAPVTAPAQRSHRRKSNKHFSISDSSSEEDSVISGGANEAQTIHERVERQLRQRPNACQPLMKQAPPQPDVTQSSTNGQLITHIRIEERTDNEQRTVYEEHPLAKSRTTSDAQPSPLTQISVDPDVVYQNTPVRHAASVDSPSTDIVHNPPNNDYANALIKPAKVSSKIQQLLQTLQRPRKKPLAEYYSDDDKELEALARVVDPQSPKAEGGVMSPSKAESLPNANPDSLYSLVHAVERWGQNPQTSKLPVGTVLDQTGRPAHSMTYAKLASRTRKLAYHLLTKVAIAHVRDGPKVSLKPGDRVALVYANNDPLNFMVAFYACLTAGILPVPIEVPLTRRDAGIQQLGFLLGGCGCRVALTSESCLKGLPKSAHGEVAEFKGWPRLHWVTTEHLSRPSKDWKAPDRLTDESTAYIEYCTDGDGSVKGVCVPRKAMLTHCRALSHACHYQTGEVMVCVLDYKREVGLWHSIQASVYNGMQVMFVPYALMKVNPSSWMQMVSRFKASTALVKSRDLHWGLLATKEHKDIKLESLRVLLVADGSNPWSLSSCDAFVAAFASCGLKADALCPTAGSSESLTASIRRPTPRTSSSSGRGVLSMAALSHCVVRVDTENSLTSLTLQDAGQIVPGGVAIVVKLSGEAQLCKADEIGEICVYAHSTASSYWGLEGKSAITFSVDPLGLDRRPLGAVKYTRTGLVGFVGPGGLVFVSGQRAGLLEVSGRTHNADDIIATVLAVDPMKFVYRGRIAVFAVNVLRDQRICIVAEQKTSVSEEDSFRWMSKVLQAVDSIHQVGVFCLALVPANHLPKSALGGVHVSDTRQRYIDGALRPSNLLMCPHTCVTNLPPPRDRESTSEVGPAAMFVGNIVQGMRIATADGRDVGPEEPTSLAHMLRMRAAQNADHILFSLITAKNVAHPENHAQVTCGNLYRRGERIASMLTDKARLNIGDHVALIFPPGIDLIAAFYGCLIAGVVPVAIRPPHAHNLSTTLPTVRMIVEVSRAVAILSTQTLIKLLKTKEAKVNAKQWPNVYDVDDAPKNPKRTSTSIYTPKHAGETCYLDFSVSTTGTLAGITMTHGGTTSLCRSLKLACELYPSRHVCLALDPYSGLGFALWCLSSIYAGHHSILIPPSECELMGSLWLTTVSQHKVRDTFCSYGVMELCVRELASQVCTLRERGLSLNCVRTCVAVAEERPRAQLVNAFCKLFAPLGLTQRAVSTSFGCRVNTTICMQGSSSPDPCTVYVDARALRNDRVTLVEKGAPHSIALCESGKIMPGVHIVIANAETKGQCADSHLGEIWVRSGHSAHGYFTVYGEEASLHADHFDARLTTGDTMTVYARTGYLGFLRQTESVTADGQLHDAVFVVGALDETMMLRGMRYHPVDVEASVMRSHRKICESAVFTWTNLLVVVAELDGAESDALDLVPAITAAVLEEQHLIVGVVVVVDPAVVPINSRGEKQRMHLRDAFLHDQLDPIYVAYNM